MTKPNTYVCSYPYQGRTQTFTIQAASFEEAEEKFKSIPWGRVDGEVVSIEDMPCQPPSVFRPVVAFGARVVNVMRGRQGL